MLERERKLFSNFCSNTHCSALKPREDRQKATALELLYRGNFEWVGFHR